MRRKKVFFDSPCRTYTCSAFVTFAIYNNIEYAACIIVHVAVFCVNSFNMVLVYTLHELHCSACMHAFLILIRVGSLPRKET